jgi:hypothetical protein
MVVMSVTSGAPSLFTGNVGVILYMPALVERFFIPPPIPTSETKKDANDQLLPVYLDEKGRPLLWSGGFPLPAIDSRVFVKMNNIGWALVKGYYASAGYVGVMTLPLSPPAWLFEQCLEDHDPDRPEWAKKGIGCEFGSELSLVDSAKNNDLQDVVLTLQYCLETFEATCQCGGCDPCTQGKRDIRRAISKVEDLAGQPIGAQASILIASYCNETE